MESEFSLIYEDVDVLKAKSSFQPAEDIDIFNVFPTLSMNLLENYSSNNAKPTTSYNNVLIANKCDDYQKQTNEFVPINLASDISFHDFSVQKKSTQVSLFSNEIELSSRTFEEMNKIHQTKPALDANVDYMQIENVFDESYVAMNNNQDSNENKRIDFDCLIFQNEDHVQKMCAELYGLPLNENTTVELQQCPETNKSDDVIEMSQYKISYQVQIASQRDDSSYAENMLQHDTIAPKNINDTMYKNMPTLTEQVLNYYAYDNSTEVNSNSFLNESNSSRALSATSTPSPKKKKNNNNRKIIKNALLENKKVLPIDAKLITCDRMKYDELVEKHKTSNIFLRNLSQLEHAIRDGHDVTFSGWTLYVVGSVEHRKKCDIFKQRKRSKNNSHAISSFSN